MASARNRRSDAESVIWPQVLLVVAVVALTLIGFVMIYSASQVTILSEGQTIGTWPVTAGADVARMDFETALSLLTKALFTL